MHNQAARHRDEAEFEMAHAGRVYDVGEVMANAQRDKAPGQHEYEAELATEETARAAKPNPFKRFFNRLFK